MISGIEASRGRKSLQEIADQLKARIAQGAYAPEQRLLEKHLGKEYGESRGRIREALRNLVSEGVLELQEQKDVRISASPSRPRPTSDERGR